MRGVSGLERPAIQWTFVVCGVALIGISTWTGVALVRAWRAIDVARDEARQASLDREQTEASLARERAARESYMLQLGRERKAAVPAAHPTLTLTPVNPEDLIWRFWEPEPRSTGPSRSRCDRGGVVRCSGPGRRFVPATRMASPRSSRRSRRTC